MLALRLVSDDKCDSNMADEEDSSCQLNSQSFGKCKKEADTDKAY